jgi:hypothetical protein
LRQTTTVARYRYRPCAISDFTEINWGTDRLMAGITSTRFHRAMVCPGIFDERL